MTSMYKRRSGNGYSGSRKQNVYVVLEVADHTWPKVHAVFSTNEKAEALREQLRQQDTRCRSEFEVSKHRIQ